jgi:hypothetical protein
MLVIIDEDWDVHVVGDSSRAKQKVELLVQNLHEGQFVSLPAIVVRHQFREKDLVKQEVVLTEVLED